MNNKELNINIPRLLGPVDEIKIGESATIEKGLYEKRGNQFYDIKLKLQDKEIFLGRFNKTFDRINTKYKDGKILIFNEKFINDGMKIVIVLSLYDIADDIFYSCTEEEAIQIFDPSIDCSNLKNKNRNILRTDIEKLKRIK